MSLSNPFGTDDAGFRPALFSKGKLKEAARHVPRAKSRWRATGTTRQAPDGVGAEFNNAFTYGGKGAAHAKGEPSKKVFGMAEAINEKASRVGVRGNSRSSKQKLRSAFSRYKVEDVPNHAPFKPVDLKARKNATSAVYKKPIADVTAVKVGAGAAALGAGGVAAKKKKSKVAKYEEYRRTYPQEDAKIARREAMTALGVAGAGGVAGEVVGGRKGALVGTVAGAGVGAALLKRKRKQPNVIVASDSRRKNSTTKAHNVSGAQKVSQFTELTRGRKKKVKY
jgi:hypothetical protein